MNIELLKKLRTRFLRMRHRKHFYMHDIAIKTDCGAAMCVAGHALELAGYKKRWNAIQHRFDWFKPNGQRVSPVEVLSVAQRELGLSFEQARIDRGNKESGLFYRFDLKTPKQAAKVIQKLIDRAAASALNEPAN